MTYPLSTPIGTRSLEGATNQVVGVPPHAWFRRVVPRAMAGGFQMGFKRGFATLDLSTGDFSSGFTEGFDQARDGGFVGGMTAGFGGGFEPLPSAYFFEGTLRHKQDGMFFSVAVNHKSSDVDPPSYGAGPYGAGPYGS